MKLAIAIPCCRDWKAAFGASLCGLIRKLTKEGAEFDLYIMQGASVLPRARQMAVNWALGGGFSHLLFLDDDMQFSADLVEVLSSPNVDVIGVNYVSKGAKKPQTHGIDGQPISSVDKLGHEEAGWIGFGAVLIRLEALKAIPAPLFEVRWLPERNDYVGEDFYFCGKVRAHGIKIHVTHDAEVAHVGDFGYREVI